jgi:Cdc6-like AAA superfamily ATPase
MRVSELALRNIFDSLLKTEYRDKNDIKELNKFYIDKFAYLFNILSNKNNFIVGRRGTGKTTLLYRAYLECMLSFSDNYKSKYLENNNNLAIYIDLNKIRTLKNDSEENFERDFILDVINELREQVNFFWKGNIKSFLLNTKDEIDKLFDNIEELIINGKMIDIEGNISLEKIKNSASKSELGTNFSNVTAKVYTEEGEEEISRTECKSIDLNVRMFYTKLQEIKEKAKINKIFIFLDEYSSLNESKQLRLAKLLKSLFDSGLNIYYKIGVISDNYNFGELRLDRDLHELSLDLDSIISSAGSTEKGIDYLKTFIEELLKNRVNYFLPENNL